MYGRKSSLGEKRKRVDFAKQLAKRELDLPAQFGVVFKQLHQAQETWGAASAALTGTGPAHDVYKSCLTGGQRLRVAERGDHLN